MEGGAASVRSGLPVATRIASTEGHAVQLRVKQQQIRDSAAHQEGLVQ